MRLSLLRIGLAVSVIGVVAASLGGGFVGGDALWPIAWLAWAPAGYLILRKQPGNAVGQTLIFIGVTMGVSLTLLALAAAPLAGRLRVWSELGNTVSGVLPWLGIIWLVLVYPGQGLAGSFERATARLLVGFGLLAAISFAITTTPMSETGAISPLAIPGLARLTTPLVDQSGFMGMLGLFAISMTLLVRRWRRSIAIERAQFRWMLLGVAVFFLVLTAGQFLEEDSGGAILLWIPAGFAIPVTIGIAITRYRLFEIDRIISRTVSYAMVAGLLGLVFFGLVTLLTVFLPSDDPLAVAFSTLVVAALFNPARRKVLHFIDRQFNRSGYESALVMDTFAGSLQNETDFSHVVDGWVDTVGKTMQPRTLAIWVRE